MGGQGVLRVDELRGAGVGGLEGQWHGLAAYYEE